MTTGEIRPLIAALASVTGDDKVQIDVPEGQEEFSNWLEEARFERGFVTARMYCGKQPKMDIFGIFAVQSWNLAHL